MATLSITKLRSLGKLFTDDIDTLIKRAELNMDARRFHRARLYWKVILVRFPLKSPAGVLVRLAKCELELGRSTTAQIYLDRLALKYPNYKTRHSLATMLDLYINQKNWQRIMEICKEIEEYSKPHGIPGLLSIARFLESSSRRITKIDEYRRQIKTYLQKKRSFPERRIAIYTAIVGGYESLKIPEFLDPQIDFILFTDQEVYDTGVFEVRPLPYFDKDPVRSSRYVKTHPHTLLPEYEIAVWIDASILIRSDFSSTIQGFINSNRAIGAIPHPQRQDIYQEASACIERSKDDKSTILNQVDKYRQFGYKGDQLIESGLMLFNLKKKETSKLLTLWWSDIDTYSRRDQLSLPIAIERLDLKWHPIMKSPQSIRNHNNFLLVPHNADSLVNEELNRLLARGNVVSPVIFSSTARKIPTFQGSVDVIVCIHNALSDTKKCLASVKKHRPNNSRFRLILIDDGSDNPTKRFLEEFSKNKEWVLLKRKGTGSGYSRAANRGLKVSTADIVFLLNSDTVVTRGWIDKMADTMFSRPNIGIVGPLSSAASHQSIPDHISTKEQTAINSLPPHMNAEDMNSFCERVSASNLQPLVPLVHGFCQAVRREVIDSVGFFDDKSFPRGYGEENDYCFRSTDAGFALAIATNTYIYHSKSKSYIGADRIKLMKDGAKKLQELHGEERISRSIKTMQANPMLVYMRDQAKRLYK